jgi:tripartite-type tricarboxylate transporter receptor subunit TctC
MRILKKAVVSAIALSTLCALPFADAVADDFPNRPIRIVVPFPPGGDIDPVARSLAERFQDVWKQPVTVENRAGGGAIIGTDYVAKSPPDGYTLLLCSVGAMTVNPHLYPNLPYNVAQDIAPVSLIATTPMVLVVNQTVQARSVADLVDSAKRAPGKLTFASAGNGNITHLAGVYFASRAGLDLVHIPYKGSGPAVIDLLGGHVNMYFNPLPSALGYLKEGKAKALAVTSARRAESLPDVPSPTSPDEFTRMIRDESARWGRLVHDYNVKVD